MIRKILVSQPQPTSPKSPYAEMAEKYGVEFTFRPFIKIVGISATEFRRQRVDILKHTAIVFTSRHAIDHFFALCKALRVKMPETMKYFAASESVALYIQKFVQYRKRKVFFGTTGKIADLVPVMAKHKGEKYLVPQNDTHNDNFSNMLDAKNLKHTDCVMYRTVSVPVTKEEVFSHGMVVLFTAAGVETLVNSFTGFEQGMLRVATLGNAARTAAEEKGLRIDVVAPLPHQPSITGAIAQYLEEEEERDRLAAETPETQDTAEQEEKLRRSVAAKKGAETKRRKQVLAELIQTYYQEVEEKRLHAEEIRKKTEGLKREAEAIKRQLEEVQKVYEEARRKTERAQREAEKARRQMREVQAKATAAETELQELEMQTARSKAKSTAIKKLVPVSSEKKKPKTAAVTVKKSAPAKRATKSAAATKTSKSK